MGIDAGRLTKRITILNADKTSVATVWAEVKAVTAREMMRSQIEIVNDLLTVMIRYRSGISTANKSLYNGYYYDIEQMTVDPREESIVLTITLDATSSGVSYTSTK